MFLPQSYACTASRAGPLLDLIMFGAVFPQGIIPSSKRGNQTPQGQAQHRDRDWKASLLITCHRERAFCNSSSSPKRAPGLTAHQRLQRTISFHLLWGQHCCCVRVLCLTGVTAVSHSEQAGWCLAWEGQQIAPGLKGECHELPSRWLCCPSTNRFQIERNRQTQKPLFTGVSQTNSSLKKRVLLPQAYRNATGSGVTNITGVRTSKFH